MNILSKLVSFVNFGTLSNQTPLPQGWFDSMSAASEEAKNSDKPLLVKVHADWCGYCKNFDEEIAYVPLLSKNLSRYDCARVNQGSAEGKKLRKEYKIFAYPAFLVFRDGEFVGKIRGYTNAPVFVDALKALEK
jgi:thiol-disulfide isomerase/thioredoxin